MVTQGNSTWARKTAAISGTSGGVGGRGWLLEAHHFQS